MLPIAIKAGLTLEEFWDNTIADVGLLIENRSRQKTEDLYNLASMTASFIGLLLNGKKLPTFDSVISKPVSWEVTKERLLDFAENANKQRRYK